jgi:hypothetical protein
MPQKTSKREERPDVRQKSGFASEKHRSGTPKPSMLTIGDDLEYRVARLHIFSGFFVRRGCPIYTVGALDRATDIDVLAFRYSELFRRELIITECKSGDTAPLDRIFWLTGVRDYMRAVQAFLVLKGTKWNVKDFAKDCGVQILDLSRISEVEASLKIAENEWPTISEKTFFESNLSAWNGALASEPRFWELYQTLITETRFDDPFVGINFLLHQLRLLTRQWSKPPDEAYFRFLISESITQLAVFLMRIAEQSFDLADEDRRGFIKKGLTYGNLDPRYADRILNSAYTMTRQAVLHYTHKFVDIDRSLFSMPVPPGTEAISHFVDEMLAIYPSSLSFPQICDLILFEAFTKRKETQGWVRRIFQQNGVSARVELVFKFISVLTSIDACPAYIAEGLVGGGRQGALPNVTQDATTKPNPSTAPDTTRADAKSTREDRTIVEQRVGEPESVSSGDGTQTTATGGPSASGGAPPKCEPRQDGLNFPDKKEDQRPADNRGPEPRSGK